MGENKGHGMKGNNYDELSGVGTSSAGITGTTGNLNNGVRDGGIGKPSARDAGNRAGNRQSAELDDGDVIRFGANEEIVVLHTPGHTAGSVSFLWRGNVFTGDTLLIDGCGRTDFQSGSAGDLYDSVTEKLFRLPDAIRVWPGHDYKGQSVSTIGWEKRHNARLAKRSREDFIALMDNLNLPRPKLMDIAVPANRQLGLPHAA